MNNTENKLDALIAALGFDVEEVVSTFEPPFSVTKALFTDRFNPQAPVTTTNYKLTKRNINSKPFNCYVACVPLPVQSDAWGSIVNYCADHVDDIENGVNDFDTLRPIWEFMKGKGNE
jgi:hypothetical protein